MAYRLAVIGGDGVGPEVTEQSLQVLGAASRRFDFRFETTDYQLGGRHYLSTGEVLPQSVEDELASHDAILLGAMGWPEVPPGVLERGLLLKLRFDFDLYVNLRPVRLYPGVPSPIGGLGPEHCDLVVVRENTEGLYSGAGGVLRRGGPDEVAIEESVNTRLGVERVIRFALHLASNRSGHLTLCHKTNVLTYSGDLWQRTCTEIAQEFPAVNVDYVHVDAACLYLVSDPGRFDVIVTDNLFGDIITDLGAAIQGGMGLAASANLNPTRKFPSMFEPVHGSAPDIAGRGWANPVGSILSLALCLDYLGESEAAKAVEEAAVTVLGDLKAMAGPEMGMTTSEIGAAIASRIGD